MIGAFRNLRDDERGASVIEFAVAAPFLGALLLGMIDLSSAYSDRLKLEQAAQRTIELVEQQRTVSSDYSTQLRTEAAAAAGITATSSNPSIRQWLECTPTDANGNPTGAPVDQGNNTLASQCPNGTDMPSRYVSVTISKDYTPIIASTYLGTNSNGKYTLTASAGIRVQ